MSLTPLGPFNVLPKEIFCKIFLFLDLRSLCLVKQLSTEFFKQVKEHDIKQHESTKLKNVYPISQTLKKCFFLQEESCPKKWALSIHSSLADAVDMGMSLVTNFALNTKVDRYYQFLQIKEQLPSDLSPIFRKLFVMIIDPLETEKNIEALISLLPVETLNFETQPDYFESYGLAIALAAQKNLSCVYMDLPLTQAVRKNLLERAQKLYKSYLWLFDNESSGADYLSLLKADLSNAREELAKNPNCGLCLCIENNESQETIVMDFDETETERSQISQQSQESQH